MQCTDDMMLVWYLGARAWADGNSIDKNPYCPTDPYALHWADGWNAAKAWNEV